jgi:hypothetical protein
VLSNDLLCSFTVDPSKLEFISAAPDQVSSAPDLCITSRLVMSNAAQPYAGQMNEV